MLIIALEKMHSEQKGLILIIKNPMPPNAMPILLQRSFLFCTTLSFINILKSKDKVGNEICVGQVKILQGGEEPLTTPLMLTPFSNNFFSPLVTRSPRLVLAAESKIGVWLAWNRGIFDTFNYRAITLKILTS